MKRATGQNKLYRKLLRRIAQHGLEHGSTETVTHLMDVTHEFFKGFYNGGKTTTTLSVTEFWTYYNQCQRASILMFGVTGMDEDLQPFDS